MMKTAILAAMIGSAAAFAPAQQVCSYIWDGDAWEKWKLRSLRWHCMALHFCSIVREEDCVCVGKDNGVDSELYGLYLKDMVMRWENFMAIISTRQIVFLTIFLLFLSGKGFHHSCCFRARGWNWCCSSSWILRPSWIHQGRGDFHPLPCCWA